ncbi:hypothetical protein DH2020_045345 [Rehmannia glutinosa]|uniref:Uncharacterized protein n=1 Tax=Rehmannia glutinosa TaxID=99300 RepID=A0ABR0UEJ5_REHGL
MNGSRYAKRFSERSDQCLARDLGRNSTAKSPLGTLEGVVGWKTSHHSGLTTKSSSEGVLKCALENALGESLPHPLSSPTFGSTHTISKQKPQTTYIA